MIIRHKQNNSEQKVTQKDFDKMPESIKEMYSVVSKTPPEAKATEAPKTGPKKTSPKSKDKSGEGSESEKGDA